MATTAKTAEIGLTAALREGLEAVPAARETGNREALQQLRDWVAKTHPHLKDKLTSPTFNTTLNGLRAKGSTATRSARTTTAPAADTEPRVSDLLRARDWLAKQKLKPAEAKKLLESLAATDLKNLGDSIDALQQFEK